MRQFKLNERQRFSIRKFSLGVASVLLGSVFMTISQISQVQATEVDAVMSPTDTLNKKELKNLINEIDGKLTRGVYATKTEESVNSLKQILEEANATLTKATTQDELTKAYKVLLTATTRLQSKPKTPKPKLEPEEESLLNKVVMVDTTNGKPTVGKKAENTEPKAGTNSIENTGSHDSRNGQLMDKENLLRTGERSAVTEEPYNSFVFSGSDNLKDNKDHSTLKLFDKDGDNNRNNASITYGEDSHGKYMEWKSTKARGGGFKLEIDKELNEEYTIGVKFSFDTTSGSWRKIIDYKNSASDNGFYFYNNGHLRFYPDSLTSTKVISSGEVVNFIIVRSKTEFSAYIVKDDGSVTKEFSSNAASTLSNSIPYKKDGKTLLGFFFDDTATGSEATTGGKVYSLSIYDKAIDPNKVLEKLNQPKNSEIYEPKLKDPLPDVEKGSTPNAEDFIKNTPTSGEPNKLPERTGITWKEKPDTSSEGLKPAKILVTYPDNTTDEVLVNVNVIAVTRPDAPKVTANEETATVSIYPIGDVDKVKVTYTPTGGTTEKTIEIVKENGVWKDKSNTPGVSVDSTSGAITLDYTVAKDGTEVKAVSTKGNSAESDEGKANDPVKQAKPAAPEVTANEETVTVNIQPIGDVDKVKVTYTPTNGTDETTIEIIKENGVWKEKSDTPTPGVSVDSTSGAITLDYTVAKDGTEVKAVSTKGNSAESDEGKANDPVKQAKPVTPEISIPNHGDALEEDTSQLTSELPIEDESERVTSNEESAKTDKNVSKQNEFQNILPNTGIAKDVGIFSAAAVSIITGLGLILPMKKENEDIQNL